MKIYDEVLEILRDLPQCRNSDKQLIWIFWQVVDHVIEGSTVNGGLASINCNEFMRTTPAESITRARRAVQAHHPELRASKPVQEARTRKQDAFQEWLYR